MGTMKYLSRPASARASSIMRYLSPAVNGLDG